MKKPYTKENVMAKLTELENGYRSTKEKAESAEERFAYEFAVTVIQLVKGEFDKEFE